MPGRFRAWRVRNLPPTLPYPRSPALDVAVNVNRAPFNSRRSDWLCQGGFALAALSGLVVLAGAFGDQTVVSQGLRYVDASRATLAVIGIVTVVLCVLAAALPYAWARLTGIGILPVLAVIDAAMVIGWRTDPYFDPLPVSIGRAGVLLVIGFVLLVAALALTLVGAPRIGRPVPAGKPSTPSGYSITSLVLSLCGFATASVTAPLGVAFAVAGLDDSTRSAGRRTARGLAVAGLVVGIVFTAVAAIIVFIIAVAADPSW